MANHENTIELVHDRVERMSRVVDDLVAVILRGNGSKSLLVQVAEIKLAIVQLTESIGRLSDDIERLDQDVEMRRKELRQFLWRILSGGLLAALPGLAALYAILTLHSGK